ncbi:adenylate/guanylate cyclase domain-containing protein [Leptospira gomenensis]|uniref:Adenylate/guanylate cyclase domain-containing protein n=1 Tax=Leptospira gomenensis TaxID=2484974 RepID=A0A5F1YA16_9LEPT|nr:adenylate/guanylate cyclase domain-containing protein [Leptospira gomenensis]TGK33311.1 adenylate/guanylate cyclase domain-containing protein [Leptospira gomenensis]TGK37393.1 adenylate/guanylate cyclase domain-containing protein [Leptospira gomenensis]TGK50881.1 adenylate/guanylate cyclase domain-containing protein [Leptospira gomenensis]TGK56504.1 adenylate/guanylate cyclase domain-containing protein [Leptospira gomenensis]
MQPTEDILGLKEKRAFRIGYIIRILLALSFTPASLSISQSGTERIWILVLYLGAAFVSAGMIWFLSEERFCLKDDNRIAGWLGVFLDVLILCILPWTWYDSVGGNSIPRTYLLKTAFIPVSAVFILLNGLSLKPLYPVLVSISAFAVCIFIFSYVSEDPRTVWTGSLSEAFLTSKASAEYYFTIVALLALYGGVTSFIAYTARSLLQESVRSERKSSQLGRYFSPGVVQRITAEDNLFAPGGSLQKVAVLFCDLRDFTSLSEKLSPQEVISLLAEYHREMVRVVFENGGSVDKFIGDGILVTFGIPESSETDCKNAVSAGLEMKKALKKLNALRLQKGQPELRQGIGIHYGDAVCGNIGTEERLEFTVIGDAVNAASRIESACKELNSDFLVSNEVLERVASENRFRAQAMGDVKVKGKEKSLSLFSILPYETELR